MTASHPSLPISIHDQGRAALGPRLQKLHRVIGPAHRDAEGMVFSRSLLQGEATPLQLASLIRALLPIYTALETAVANLPDGLGHSGIPWADLSRHQTLEQDVAAHADVVAHHPELAELDALVETVVTSLTNFPRPIAELKQELHNGIEQWPLTDAEEAALLEEAPAGFRLNQKLLRALAELAPASVSTTA